MALVAATPANGQLSQVTESSIAEETPASKIDSEGIDFPYQFKGSPSRQKELDISSAVALKSEEYRQLFRLPPGEVLVQDFNCALQESILHQGHMYLFRNYVCFYSNIFGFETKKIIPFSEITVLRRAKTAGIFPNAIEIFTGDKKHFFASFLSRDEAFNLISDLWPEEESNCKENLRQQAHELLKKKKLDKQEVSFHPVNEDILDHSNKKAEPGDVSKLLPETACASPLFGGKIASIFSATKRQSYLRHLIFFVVPVLLLMQLTVVLLISRQPQVQPVYQMDYFNGMNQGLHPSPQELAWLEKHLHHIKQEMYIVDSLLERMRLEHKHLKSQLEDFGQFRTMLD